VHRLAAVILTERTSSRTLSNASKHILMTTVITRQTGLLLLQRQMTAKVHEVMAILTPLAIVQTTNVSHTPCMLFSRTTVTQTVKPQMVAPNTATHFLA